MSFFLGIFPDRVSEDKINNITGDIKEIFDDFGIPVRWSKSESYHMTLIHLGESLPFYKKLFLQYRLRNLKFKKFKLTFNTVKLGISRKYKELIYLDVLKGGDEMRNIFLDLRGILNIQNEGNFLPHLTLGRVSKELSDQEYSNISRDLVTVTKKLNISEIEFVVEEINLVQSSEGNYEVLFSFKDLSRIKS